MTVILENLGYGVHACGCMGTLVYRERLFSRLACCKIETLSLSLFLPYCGACRAERSQSVCPTYKLQLEECLSAEQVPTPELIQGYVKKVGLLYECQPEGFVRCDHLGCREGEIGRHECIVLVFI